MTWTDKDIQFLKENVNIYSRKELAKILNRSEKSVRDKISYLKIGSSKTASERMSEMNKKDNGKIGEVYNSLTVIEPKILFNAKSESFYKVKCKCICGNIKSYRLSDLDSDRTKSCGCQKAVSRRKLCFYKKDLYRIWNHIKNRCLKKNNIQYHNYGGRGIKISEEWLQFENFYKDMGDRPSKNHSIDRINVNGNYEKENCRWATIIEQANNRRNNKLLTIYGETKTLSNWARDSRCLVDADLLSSRVLKGWDHLRAITTPKRKRNYLTEELIKIRKLAREHIRVCLRNGKLIKPNKCEVCDDTKIQAHHWMGYDKENWANVKWLCPKCHARHEL